MKRLLEVPGSRGYPTEYLLARLRGRSSRFIKEWDGPLYSPDPAAWLRQTRYSGYVTEYSGEGAWKGLLKEFKWIYSQMNDELRGVFYPFFVFTEIKTVILCFRYKKVLEESLEINKILDSSLLSGEIKRVLAMKADLQSVLKGFEQKTMSLYAGRPGLEDAFLNEGLKGLEQRLTIVFFDHIINSGLHPVLHAFFSFLVDSKNITAAYKHVRWGLEAQPYLISGGSLAESRLKKAVREKDMPAVMELIHAMTGLVIEESPAPCIERALHAGLLKQAKTMYRENMDIGLVLYYLWRACLETMNLSIILYGRDIDRNVLKEELVIS